MTKRYHLVGYDPAQPTGYHVYLWPDESKVDVSELKLDQTFTFSLSPTDFVYICTEKSYSRLHYEVGHVLNRGHTQDRLLIELEKMKTKIAALSKEYGVLEKWVDNFRSGEVV